MFLAVCAGLAVAVLPAAAQQRDFSQVQMKATHVAGKVHMLEGSGGNIGVSVGSDGLLIVDDQYAPLADKIRAALQGLGQGKLRFVLNTHWHGDHTGGNASFSREATIVAHDNVRKRLAADQKVLGNAVPASPPEALPVITFGQSLSFHFNGEEIKALHFPHGHTDGDSIVFFTGSNVIHMGDHFFVGRFPFIDLENGGSVQGFTDNVGKVIAQLTPGVKIIPGHGPLAGPEELRAFHRMLTETTAIVRKAMEAGKSLEEIQAQGLGEEWKPWGAGFIDSSEWIAAIHASFSNRGPHAHADGTHH
jgi:glyoxylase-like metal-dependent hydrolase (beta-lactamase superfamily II)